MEKEEDAPSQHKRKSLSSRYKTGHLLEKWGWSQGKGLGKREDGTKDFIRVSEKRDQKGIGANPALEDNWWEHLYDGAMKKSNQSDEQKKKKEEEAKEKKPLVFGMFMKASSSIDEDSDPEEDPQPKKIRTEPLNGRMFSQSATNSQGGKLKRLKSQETVFLESRSQKSQEPKMDIASKKNRPKTLK
eukprot:TRINITY_DN6304_c0_g1_i2.p2 TRINITY_DN6304_c0_g1~~TRINITY_DN6304_c0_g1_i2.p2  ORF type:complete len:187 (-),score=45.02 TRINITY_DN6304_c0_g1_i2:17-577(-)